MPVNPYESPRSLLDDEHAQLPVGDAARPYIYALVIPIAGIIGGGIFISIISAFNTVEGAFQFAIWIGIAAVFSVLTVTDGFIQGKLPAFVSAIIGMLLTSPFAYGLAFWLGLQAYDLGTSNRPGANLVGLLCYFSFFLTLSLGGWVAICRTRRAAVSEENQVSN